MAIIRANIPSICSLMSAHRWILRAGVSIYLKQSYSLIDRYFLPLRVDYILGFRFPPYNVGDLFFPHLSFPH